MNDRQYTNVNNIESHCRWCNDVCKSEFVSFICSGFFTQVTLANSSLCHIFYTYVFLSSLIPYTTWKGNSAGSLSSLEKTVILLEMFMFNKLNSYFNEIGVPSFVASFGGDIGEAFTSTGASTVYPPCNYF
ncbi:hypothetical protein [Paenibacillus sp. FSL R5-0914]|uniref:hypothetical protein n=1 Tax=Paenibacillus sp. FSL R5-0914 TaxID=2921665 RepID=UPI0030FA2869